MGYDIMLGQAEVYGQGDPEGWEGRLHVGVLAISRESAPHLPNIGSPRTNRLSRSYFAWPTFLSGVGLSDLFFDREEGLMREHPGCFLLQEKHYDAIHAAFEKTWGSLPTDSAYIDNYMAMLLWLKWWVRYTLDTCSIPAIENT